MNYPIGDFLIQLKNAYMARKKSISYRYSKVIFALSRILKEEKYVEEVTVKEIDKKKMITIVLAYKGRRPILHNVRIISKPSARIYVGRNDIPKAEGGFGLTLVSTNKGVMSDKKARKEKLGGEIICQVY